MYPINKANDKKRNHPGINPQSHKMGTPRATWSHFLAVFWQISGKIARKVHLMPTKKFSEFKLANFDLQPKYWILQNRYFFVFNVIVANSRPRFWRNSQLWCVAIRTVTYKVSVNLNVPIFIYGPNFEFGKIYNSSLCLRLLWQTLAVDFQET